MDRRPVKMMLGFVVRRCERELGRAPTPAEFAAWANTRGEGWTRYALFGRPISEEEARVILSHPGRLVSARPAPEPSGGPAAEAAAPAASETPAAARRPAMVVPFRRRS